MPRLSPERYGAEVCAFLDMLAASEGTSSVAGSDDGYNVEVGGTLFHSYETHPLASGVFLAHLNIFSTAAGRYQLLHKYFAAYAKQLRLSDFSPLSQDLIAVQQISERGALGPIRAGNWSLAVELCAKTWASLPGAGYGQHEQSLDFLHSVYLGSLAKLTHPA